jgi:hypothetical protein
MKIKRIPESQDRVFSGIQSLLDHDLGLSSSRIGEK